MGSDSPKPQDGWGYCADCEQLADAEARAKVGNLNCYEEILDRAVKAEALAVGYLNAFTGASTRIKELEGQLADIKTQLQWDVFERAKVLRLRVITEEVYESLQEEVQAALHRAGLAIPKEKE